MELKNLAAALAALLAPVPVAIAGKERAMIHHDSLNIEDIENLQPAPFRIRETFAAVGLPSFVSYVNRYKDDASTIFVTPDLTSLANGAVLATAVLDYHVADAQPAESKAEPNAARWGTHKATLFARPSLPYAKLLALDGKMLDQPSFAQALEDIARFSSSHSSADLIEIARTINLTSKGDFKNFEDELSGSVEFKFDVMVKGSAGTQTRALAVPSTIDFVIPLIDGLKPVVVTAKFLYRVPENPGSKITLGIKIVDRVWLEDAAVNEAKAEIAELTKLPVYVGKL